MDEGTNRKIAVLIDAENISCKYVKLVLDEASRFGTVICKRIYADWSSNATASWRKVVQDYSIHTIQQFSNTAGKNSSDSAMIIDAMDLLHEGRLQGFCLVSSDSDFTRLASRLRESEMLVVGMGEQKTPSSFINACDKFSYLDILLKQQEKETGSAEIVKTKPKLSGKARPSPNAVDSKNSESDDAHLNPGMNKDAIIKTIAELVEENSDEDGWYFLGVLGNQLLSQYPDFDARNFGFSKLSAFVKSIGTYDFRSDPHPAKLNVQLVYIRKKQG